MTGRAARRLRCSPTGAVALLLAAACAAPAAAEPSSQPPRLPVAPVHDVVETFFGTAVHDPYRAFEHPRQRAVAAWMLAHSAHAHAVLSTLPRRAALRAKLEAWERATPAQVDAVVRLPGDRYFYLRRGSDDDQYRLYRRQGLGGREHLVVDPEARPHADGLPRAIDYFAPSPDGSRVALGVSAGGSEDAALQVVDGASGRPLGPPISRVRQGIVAWSPDGRELYFVRDQALRRGMPAAERDLRASLVVLRPGEGRLRTIVRAGRDLGLGPAEVPTLEIEPDGRVLLLASDGVSTVLRGWTSTLAALRAGRPAWRRLFDADDGITAFAVHGARAYALSFRDAPRYRLLAGPVDGFDPRRAEVLVAESERVLAGIAAAADALYLEVRDGNRKRLLRLGYEGGAPAELALPFDGGFTLDDASVRPDVPGVVFALAGWARARRIVAAGADGRVVDTGLQALRADESPADIEVDELRVPSHDGVAVPLTIVRRRSQPRDGRAPTVLYGYGAYGDTEEPSDDRWVRLWLDAGGVYAVVNPRGSGVYGRRWHEDGMRAAKPNTWKDANACAEALVAAGWTRPEHLAIWGASAGGILAGRALTSRPDLYAAVVLQAAALDMVRAELEPNGVSNIPEFGSRADEAGLRALVEMSTYHQIRDDVAYPAVLLLHGLNDPRVAVANATKTAARLMAASRSGKPVLLRLDETGGHGIGATKTQRFDELADVTAFLLWQLGPAAGASAPAASAAR